MSNNQCNELKNINYQSMLLNNNKSDNNQNINSSNSNNTLENFEDFLEKEKNTNMKNITWSKLNKMNKMNKLRDFANEYCKSNDLNEEIKNELNIFLKLSLDRKRLQRVKDIDFDKKTGTVKNIPGLQYKKNVRKFTLKNNDKNASSLKNLGNGKSKNNIKHIKYSNNRNENK